MIRICLVVFPLLTVIGLVGGCTTVFPRDLAIVSVELVNEKYQVELPAPPPEGSIKMIDPYFDYLVHLEGGDSSRQITKEDIKKYFRSASNNVSFLGSKPDIKILKIEFTSQSNLYKYTKSKKLTLKNSSYLCEPDDKEVVKIKPWPFIYWEGLNISSYFNFLVEKDRTGKFKYYTFIDLPASLNVEISDHVDVLNKLQGGICFQIRGGGITGRGFESNVVTISK